MLAGYSTVLPTPDNSGCCVEAPYLWGFDREWDVTSLCFAVFFGWQPLSVTVVDALLLEWMLGLKSQKDVHHSKPYFKLTGFQEVWPFQTCLINMPLFSHHLQDCWHQYIFVKAQWNFPVLLCLTFNLLFISTLLGTDPHWLWLGMQRS